MNIAGYEVHAIETGEFALDGGAMFGVVPKTLWDKRLPVDEKNRVSLNLRTLLLVGHGKRILVDTGIGTKWDPKLQSIYRIDHSKFSLATSLNKLGLTPEDITDVILTHLHFDHAGGATTRHGDEIVPTFPKATYYVQQKNLEWALRATEKDRASYLTENFEPLMTARKLTLLDGPSELFPGVELQIFHGHTAYQQLPKISDGPSTLFFCADEIPTSAHLAPPCILAYDNFPLTTLEEKKRLLEQATDQRWMLFFEHCPLMAACIPIKTDKGYAIGETVTL
ncbi:MAG: MBL fold metallo-hydrolase [Deltaproteobacteria bacterium]|nr:MBL fold metallo-hydrolase [Deltaproteobacteria bacterium]